MCVAKVFLQGQTILIDKPKYWSSFQALKKVRFGIQRQFGISKLKLGHAGTLDPLATGLLVLCSGKMTKNIDAIQKQKKQYTGTFVLGATTPSYDLETEFDATFPTAHISEGHIRHLAGNMIGEISQQPPIYSAIKKKGKRLYEFARAKQDVEISLRKVQIYEFDITKIDMPQVHFRVLCSKGTYIRSLANDFGKGLQSGAYLHELRRTKVGNYSVEDALKPDDFLNVLNQNLNSI
ncbi:tRNA pseudouridine synthase B [Elysia marginata]|uniref:tRNA pseudouridine(55) synthase n=1 Tax=Elysia marginata TaxID=1093978 RepID=A0AAV4GTH9_9GAST|nr:tRNA pseudouridine synthase B [Elysia marginata]